MKIFPVGTSRLHEPLSLLDQKLIEYPGMGYFHSSSQALNAIQIATGELNVDVDKTRLLFRKDQTKNNPFDTNLWTPKFADSINRIKEQFASSDVILLEISSPRSYLLNEVHVQGNPNYYRDVSYAEVWKDGYYRKYMPDLNVIAYDDFDSIFTNLSRIESIAGAHNKHIVLMGHLIDPKNPNAQRVKNNHSLQDACSRLSSERIKFYEQSHLVGQHGFRILEDGSTDIHHLPWTALEQQVAEIQDVLTRLR